MSSRRVKTKRIRWQKALCLSALPVLAGIVIGITTAPSSSARPLAANPARPLLTGISYLGGDSNEFTQASSAGAQLVHTWVRWAGIAPQGEPRGWDPGDPGDPHYDWQALDAWVTEATRAGLVPLLQLYGAPEWAQRCRRVSPTGAPCNPDPAKLAEFARAAARRYSGGFQALPRVRYWQAQNEPNLSLFFNPQYHAGRPVSPALYRNLINAFYRAVKSVDPLNIVLAAGLAPIARPGSAIAPLRFAELLLCMRGGGHDPKPTRGDCGGGVFFDVFDMHPYTTGGPDHRGRGGNVELGNLSDLQNLLRAASQAGRIHGRFRKPPLWITEFSWDSKPPDPGGLPMRIQTRWVAEALHRAWTAGVTRFFWFTSQDDAPNPNLPFSETHESGLHFYRPRGAPGRPKRVLYAFRFPFVAYSKKDGFYFWGRTPTSTGGGVLIQVWRRGRWQRTGAAWANRHGIFEGKMRGFYGRRKRGWVRAVYRRERSVPFSLKPVRDFHQPPFGRPVQE